jgi:Protein of unknown function (DUF1353)
MKPLYSAVALCFIAFGTAAPLVMPSQDPWAFASAELSDGVITGKAPTLIPYPNGKGYVLTMEYRLTVNGETLVIPRGFLFDGASVPRAAWFFIGDNYEPDFMIAALAHDWLYWSHQWPKEKADKALRDLLKASGVGAIRTAAMYRAVDLAGGPAWRKSPGVTADSLWIIEGDEIVAHPNLIRADSKVAA